MRSTFDQTLRLGTRGSKLALAQSQQIADRLMSLHAGLHVEIVICKTTGDRITDRALQDIGGKGLFVKEIEEGLLRKEIDFAVHSFKDLPVTEPLVDESELMIAAVPARADCRDVLSGRFGSIGELPPSGIVGTGSLRRRCQLLKLRPDLDVRLIRGNVDTRLEKLMRGEFDAIVLAAAGLNRCGLFDAGRDHIIEPDEMLPAAAQGALALQCRYDDSLTIAMLKPMDDPVTRLCTDLERGIVAELEGDCHSPIAALGEVENGEMRLRTRVGRRGGSPPIIDAEAHAPLDRAIESLRNVVESLRSQNARNLLSKT